MQNLYKQGLSLLLLALISCSTNKSVKVLEKRSAEATTVNPEQSKSQLSEVEHSLKFYKGLLGGRTKIWLGLVQRRMKLHGYYYYEKHKKPIILTGDIDATDGTSIKLKEIIGAYSNGDVVAEIKLKKSPNGATGFWISVEDSQRLELALTETTSREFLDAVEIKDPILKYPGICGAVNSSNDDKSDSFYVAEISDLNGDSIPEKTIACANDCGATGNCTYLIYLSRKNGYVFAGILGARDFNIGKKITNGVSEISTSRHGGSAEPVSDGHQIYKFNGLEFE